jgi:hypothetical protein
LKHASEFAGERTSRNHRRKCRGTRRQDGSTGHLRHIAVKSSGAERMEYS